MGGTGLLMGAASCVWCADGCVVNADVGWLDVVCWSTTTHVDHYISEDLAMWISARMNYMWQYRDLVMRSGGGQMGVCGVILVGVPAQKKVV